MIFAGFYIGDQFEAEHVQGNTFRCSHVFGALRGFTLAVDQRPDTPGIAQRQNAIPGDHDDGGIGTAAAPVHARDSVEHVVHLHAQLALPLQLMGKDIQQHLGV